MSEKPAMIRCWASALNECSQDQSREHLVSASIFPGAKAISVSGFPWCKGETRMIGLANLTSKILCTKHNSLLSPLDVAAGNAFRKLNESAILSNKRLSIQSSKFKVRHFHLDGLKLERWLLKTLINLCNNTEYFLEPNLKIPGIPSQHQIQICFGKASFLGKSGLYLTTRQGAEIDSRTEIGFSPIIEENEKIVVGGFFNFRGFLLFLSLMEEIPNNFDWINSLGPWSGTQPSWHFNKMTFVINNKRSHFVHFDWK